MLTIFGINCHRHENRTFFLYVHQYYFHSEFSRNCNMGFHYKYGSWEIWMCCYHFKWTVYRNVASLSPNQMAVVYMKLTRRDGEKKRNKLSAIFIYILSCFNFAICKTASLLFFRFDYFLQSRLTWINKSGKIC